MTALSSFMLIPLPNQQELEVSGRSSECVSRRSPLSPVLPWAWSAFLDIGQFLSRSWGTWAEEPTLPTLTQISAPKTL